MHTLHNHDHWNYVGYVVNVVFLVFKLGDACIRFPSLLTLFLETWLILEHDVYEDKGRPKNCYNPTTLYSKIQDMHKVGRKRRGENHKEVEERERRHISLVFVKIHVVIFPMMRHLYRIFFSTSLWDFVNRVHSWKRSWVWRRWQSQTHYNTHQDFPNGSFKMSGSQSVRISNKTVPFLRMCVEEIWCTKVPWYVCFDVPWDATTQRSQHQIPPTLRAYQFRT